MNAPSGKAAERARKNLAAIFSGLSVTTQAKVAEALSVAEGTVSKWKDDELVVASNVMAACGLKVVPEGYRCVNARTMELLLDLAGQRMDALRREPEGLFEDPE